MLHRGLRAEWGSVPAEIREIVISSSVSKSHSENGLCLWWELEERRIGATLTASAFSGRMEGQEVSHWPFPSEEGCRVLAYEEIFLHLSLGNPWELTCWLRSPPM